MEYIGHTKGMVGRVSVLGRVREGYLRYRKGMLGMLGRVKEGQPTAGEGRAETAKGQVGQCT